MSEPKSHAHAPRQGDVIETVRENIVYENNWVIIRDDDVRFPSGARGTYYYPQWKAPHGVAVIILVNRHILLLRNYRYAEKAHSLEIPMGFGTTGSTPEADARRELFEELGIAPERLTALCRFGSLYVTHLFLWQADTLPAVVHDHQEQSEAISGYSLLPLDDLRLNDLPGKDIHDPMTVAAILIARGLANDDLLVE